MKAFPVLIFVLTALFFVSACSDASNVSTNPADDDTTEVSATTPQNTTTVQAIEDASGKISDEVVQKACACQEGARQEDGTVDFPKMGECMGGKNKIQFVQDLLGAEATEKERSDAEKVLTEKMNLQCPI